MRASSATVEPDSEGITASRLADAARWVGIDPEWPAFALALGEARERCGAGGEPMVEGLEWDTIDDGTYMDRVYVLRTRQACVRFHHILSSDAGRDLHDHPWDFASFLLDGQYCEETGPWDAATHIRYRAGAVLYRPAEALHRLELPAGPVWSLVVAGPVRREWGFRTSLGWVSHKRYRGTQEAPAR